jgi:hypothetical protein
MDKTRDLAQLIETQIDQPTIEKVRRLYDQGLVTRQDLEKFRVSARRYKEAILTQHDSLEVEVRDELVKSLLSDYQKTVDGLVRDIAKRIPSEATQAPAQLNDPNPTSRPEEVHGKQRVVPERAAPEEVRGKEHGGAEEKEKPATGEAIDAQSSATQKEKKAEGGRGRLFTFKRDKK